MSIYTTVCTASRYTHLLRLLESTRDYEEQDQLDRAEALKISLTSNLALTAFQQQEYVRSIEWCDKTLQLDPDNAKVCWDMQGKVKLKVVEVRLRAW
jgi:hypothetical protein